ncbi:phosphate propanoyltransferase [Bacillus salipaludis]|uniref:Phosphate propanoyltransferase n=1 Tax=Bacillus salipaludis TaxID=2547811 RepID=A0A4R5VSU5_9BACI|nr:phosphate propanoyltransferase [Bacillus salipaludis]MDQ6598533.1 phosphate propanoyltransferase [Bacillus salipaludis]TDK60910.1 phosphate propanoyltransferase [Bacillus salipaludis]
MNKEKIQAIVEEVVKASLQELKFVPIAASNRHIHLSGEHVDRLFGRGYKLTKLKELSQPNQFAAKETVTLIGPNGKIQNVRVLGPSRGKTQVEISLFDGFTLGVNPPIRQSGDLKGSAGITIQGPRGQIQIQEGLICAARHVHMHPSDAENFGVSDGDYVQVKTRGERGIIFSNVLIRVSPKYRLEMHLDLDEANAANLKNGQLGEIVSIERKGGGQLNGFERNG